MAVRFSQTPCVKPALGARRRVASRVICSASTGSVACTSRRSLLLAGLIAVPAAELLLPSVRPAHAETQSFAEDAVDEYSRLEASGMRNLRGARNQARGDVGARRQPVVLMWCSERRGTTVRVFRRGAVSSCAGKLTNAKALENIRSKFNFKRR